MAEKRNKNYKTSGKRIPVPRWYKKTDNTKKRWRQKEQKGRKSNIYLTGVLGEERSKRTAIFKRAMAENFTELIIKSTNPQSKEAQQVLGSWIKKKHKP